MEVKSKNVKLYDILEEIKSRFQDLSDSKKINLDLSFTEKNKDFTIRTDPILIKKIVSHLLDNAIKFTSEGSVTFGCALNNSVFEFYVKDTGIGITKEAQDHVFKIFMQENVSNTRGYEGSGLGLSIINGLLKLMGGKIRLESEKGFGSTFFVTLPLSKDIQEKIVKANTPIKTGEAQLPVVLIVEDDFANYSYIETVLEGHASKTYYAKNGNEAVEICHSNPDITIVLMDVKMPIMNGYEATKEIKTFRKDLPIIAITAFAMSGDESKAYEAGCDDYLPKPTNREHLLSKIKSFGFNI